VPNELSDLVRGLGPIFGDDSGDQALRATGTATRIPVTTVAARSAVRTAAH